MALLIAHRGGYPPGGDNTAAAFAHAVALGVDMLECDVQRTADGVLVLSHDGSVRIDGRKRAVRDLDLATLRRVHPDLLSFDDFLTRFAPHAALNVDLKGTGYERAVVEALRRHGLLARALISTQHMISLRRVAALEPALGRGLSRGHLASSIRTAPLTWLAARWLRLTLPPLLWLSLPLARATAVMLQHRVITPCLVDCLRSHGYHVFTWTVDDAAEAARVTAAGVTGLASNRPEAVADHAASSTGVPLP